MGFFTTTAPSNSSLTRISGEFLKPGPASFRRKRRKLKREIDLSGGIQIQPLFPDPENLLETAYEDVRGALPAAGPFPVVTEKDGRLEEEEALIAVTEKSVRIASGGVEGIRRGLYEISRRLRTAPGPFLEPGKTHLRYFIRNRISRCFYGPTHRPPNDIDELADDVDYYPEPYLNQLAREGINALWLTVYLSEVTWSFIEAPDARMEERLNKLEKVVRRCRRYGIRIFLFFIEPVGFVNNKGLVEKHPELEGVDWGYNMKCFCPTSQTAFRHLYEQQYHLFSRIPELGGVINIPYGEALCSCFFGGTVPIRCPRCHDLPPWRVLRNSIDPMLQGMRAANPKAEYVCWLYLAAGEPEDVEEWVYDCIRNLPEGVVYLGNFESGIVVKQQGKVRHGGDYWQGQPGCSKRFRRMALTARGAGVRMGAKMQISNSHELATVPVIPIPGTLHRKYRILRELGVDTVMYSWYFGCFPGLMNRAAEKLSRTSAPAGNSAFLSGLGREEFGADGGSAAEAWKLFSRAFACYPVNSGVQYIGPFNAGIVWELFPEAVLRDLTPAWQPYTESGDCIGQALRKYSLEDAEKQTKKMTVLWERGMALLRPLRRRYPEDSEQGIQLLRAEACGIIIRNAWLVFRFYRLRRDFYEGSRRALPEMEKIVKEAILLTRRMTALCRKDVFLGYHSEAEFHKFSPELLRKRENRLRALLKKDFPRLRRPGALPGFPEKVFCRQMEADGEPVRMRNFRFHVKQAGDEIAVTAVCPKNIPSDSLISEKIVIQVCDRLCTTFPQVCSFDRERLKPDTQPCRLEIIHDPEFWGATAYIPVGMYHSKKLAFDVLLQRMEGDRLVVESWSCPGSTRANAKDVRMREMGVLLLE